MCIVIRACPHGAYRSKDLDGIEVDPAVSGIHQADSMIACRKDWTRPGGLPEDPAAIRIERANLRFVDEHIDRAATRSLEISQLDLRAVDEHFRIAVSHITLVQSAAIRTASTKGIPRPGIEPGIVSIVVGACAKRCRRSKYLDSIKVDPAASGIHQADGMITGCERGTGPGGLPEDPATIRIERVYLRAVDQHIDR